MEVIRFDHVASRPIDVEGYVTVDWMVGADGSLLFLSVEPAGRDAVFERYAGGLGTFPVTKMKQPKRFRLHRVTALGSIEKVELPLLDVAFPLVDIFPDGKLLLASARSRWRAPNDYDLNGFVVDLHTSAVSRILLGDGISNLAIDGAGFVWVSYGDEGIYGNFGWGPPDGPEPVGAAGLVCFSQTGDKLWEFPVGRRVMDCYALNVCGTDVSIYYYEEFPICRISANRTIVSWKTELRGCNEFAISKTEALFTGQYDDAPDIGYRGTLQDGKLREVQAVRFAVPVGTQDFTGKFVGRGRHLYFVDHAAIYRTSLP